MTEKEKKPSASKKKQGRPTDYTLDKADQICDWYSNGKTLTKCCQDLGIGRTTLYRWMVAHKEFSERLARARARAKQCALSSTTAPPSRRANPLRHNARALRCNRQNLHELHA